MKLLNENELRDICGGHSGGNSPLGQDVSLQAHIFHASGENFQSFAVGQGLDNASDVIDLIRNGGI